VGVQWAGSPEKRQPVVYLNALCLCDEFGPEDGRANVVAHNLRAFTVPVYDALTASG